jgi:hypothetical protein
MNKTAAEYPAEVNEFEVAGLTPVPSDMVRPPRVAPMGIGVNMECRLNQVVPIGKGSHPDRDRGDRSFRGRMLMHLRDDIINGHRIDHPDAASGPTGRLAGPSAEGYCHTLLASAFEMVCPVYQPASEVAR